MGKKSSKPSVGSEIVRRLKRFTEKLDETDDIHQSFTGRTIQLNLRPAEYDAKRVRKVRQELGASQAIFAQFLGVSLSAVRDWEQGQKPPSGAARRFMDEIHRNPEYFLNRLRELSSPAR